MCVCVCVPRWEQFDKNYLSKILLRKSVYRKSELWEVYQKINIRDAISVIDQVRDRPTTLSPTWRVNQLRVFSRCDVFP